MKTRERKPGSQETLNQKTRRLQEQHLEDVLYWKEHWIQNQRILVSHSCSVSQSPWASNSVSLAEDVAPTTEKIKCKLSLTQLWVHHEHSVNISSFFLFSFSSERMQIESHIPSFLDLCSERVYLAPFLKCIDLSRHRHVRHQSSALLLSILSTRYPEKHRSCFLIFQKD